MLVLTRMTKFTITIFLILYYLVGYSQNGILLFSKNNRTLTTFIKGSYIAFQLKSKQWLAGIITKVQNDSIYLKPLEVIYGTVNNDTLASDILSFSLLEIYALPKKGVQIDYRNGYFQISTSGGHVHWYWIKSGWIFRVLGIGYAGLVVTNGLIQNNLSLSGSKLGIAAALFLFGELLHLSYKPTLRLGKKYKLECITVRQ